MEPFRNEPLLELRRAPVRARLLDALRELRAPLQAPVWIGHWRGSAEGLDSTDPGDPERLVARAGVADQPAVDEAVACARGAVDDWSRRGAAGRAQALLGAAAVLRERRYELAALEVLECAKPWGEADADVCEAIDFLEYYARQAVALEQHPADPPLIQLPGERNALRWLPRGVAAVIAPWNFPLAIPMGMIGGALAAGNAVCFKPAEQAPGVGLRVVEALRAGGVPADAIHLLPGWGDTGARLVEHPDVSTIAFTGSSQVGLQIIQAAAQPAGPMLKRVVAEMGGKNAIIVDSDADLDDAVPAIVTSAFGYAGQKCSACDRVLCHQAAADALLERLSGAVEVLQVGSASDFASDVGPVIDEEARQRVEGYAARAAREGRIVARAEGELPGAGNFCAPAVATDLPLDSPVLQEEIFGPLVTVTVVPDLQAACDEVDRSPFALTGGLFSRSPAHIEYVTGRTPVGNFYVNRHITGAMVGRQPFGGNRRSGIGFKAGGPGYLLQFVEPRVLCENTMRHGLVAE